MYTICVCDQIPFFSFSTVEASDNVIALEFQINKFMSKLRVKALQ